MIALWEIQLPYQVLLQPRSLAYFNNYEHFLPLYYPLLSTCGSTTNAIGNQSEDGNKDEWRLSLTFQKRSTRDSITPASPGRNSLTRSDVCSFALSLYIKRDLNHFCLGRALQC